MNRDELIANELAAKLNLSINLTPDNLGKQVSKLQKLQALLQHYQALQRHQQAIEETSKTIERNREMQYLLKEWKYNRDNPTPGEDLGNGKLLVTLWKALPEDYDY